MKELIFMIVVVLAGCAGTTVPSTQTPTATEWGEPDLTGNYTVGDHGTCWWAQWNGTPQVTAYTGACYGDASTVIITYPNSFIACNRNANISECQDLPPLPPNEERKETSP